MPLPKDNKVLGESEIALEWVQVQHRIRLLFIYINITQLNIM
jgi:hypothetical protein